MKKLKLLLLISFLGVKTVAQAPTNGLVAYYGFQNTLNSNSASHNFTNVGTNNVSYTTGKDGQGANFNGNAALLNTTMTNVIWSQAKYTVAWWEYRPVGTPGNFSTSFEIGETNYYRATNSSGCNAPTYYPNRYEFGLLDGSFRCLTLEQQSASAGVWVHHAVVHNGTSVSYYNNGNLTVNGWLLNYSGFNFSNSNFIFGGGTNSGAINPAKAMNGILDELYVYNRALTDAEVALVKNATYSYTPVPMISSVSATPSTNSATINYSLNASGQNTTSVIKYGTSAAALTSQITGQNASGTSTNPYSSIISGLNPVTTYYYQIEATNATGTTQSAILNFQTQGLITEYNFNNTYNNALGNTPFTANAGTSFVTDRNGNPNSAININNTGTTATIPNLPYSNSPRTVSVWVKTNALNGGGYNFIYTYGTTSNYYGAYYSGSTLYHFSTGGSHGIANTLGLFNWTHYVFTYNGTASKIYKNGVLVGTQAIAFNTFNNANLFRLGLSETGNANYFNGAIDDLKIYNYAISDSEVLNLYTNNSTLASKELNLQNTKPAIYPNPATDTFTIQMENDLKSVEIYSIQGQKILTSKSKKINISGLAKGIYLVKITDSKDSFATQKLIVK